MDTAKAYEENWINVLNIGKSNYVCKQKGLQDRTGNSIGPAAEHWSVGRQFESIFPV